MPKRRSIIRGQVLLARFPGSAAAYSTRRLSNTYSGPALRVRRAADNVEVDVPFAANTALGTTDMEGFLRSYTGGFGTNLLLYSEEFDNAYWSGVGVAASPNAAASPIGIANAESIADNASNGPHAIFRTGITAASNSAYTASIYVKAGTHRYAMLQIGVNNSNARYSVIADLQTGSITSTNVTGGAQNVSSSITAVGNGFYRLTASALNVSGTIQHQFGFSDVASPVFNTDNNVVYSGTGTTLIFWGAQLELGSTATTYDYKRDTANTSAFVTTWYDQSGNARHATQTTAANQPRIVNAGVVDKVNGRASVKFDNLLFLRNSALTLTDPTTSTFSVAVKDAAGVAATANSRIVSLAGAGNDFAAGGQICTYIATDNGLSATPPDAGGFSANSGRGFNKYTYGQLSQFSSLFTASSHTHYRNGAVGTVVNAANTLNSTAIALGVTQTSATAQGTDGYLNGNISEVILYPSDQSANRAAIESNIMSFFGITA